MPIVYVGRTTYQIGKTLWEIIGNLKDFGVGRIITRGTFLRYPEPCYIKICKVEARPNEESRKVKVWVEKVFRGRKYPELLPICGVSYKPDYQLIPKDEEESFMKCTSTPTKTALLPRTAPLPPLLRELIIRDMKSKGQPSKEPRMTMLYQNTLDNVINIASDDSEATVKIDLGLGKPVSPQLYEGVL